MTIPMGKEYRVLLCVSLLVFTACLLFSSQSASSTQADGGAPNLAYVSGTSSGISVIDVGLAKVTRIFPNPGTPDSPVPRV